MLGVSRASQSSGGPQRSPGLAESRGGWGRWVIDGPRSAPLRRPATFFWRAGAGRAGPRRVSSRRAAAAPGSARPARRAPCILPLSYGGAGPT